jgi:hypothetical protein
MVFLWFSYGFPMVFPSNHDQIPGNHHESVVVRRPRFAVLRAQRTSLHLPWNQHGGGPWGPGDHPPAFFIGATPSHGWFMVYDILFFLNGNIIELSKSLVVIRVRVCYGYDWTAYICFDDQIWVKHDDFPERTDFFSAMAIHICLENDGLS